MDNMEIKSKAGEVMMDLLIEDYEEGLGSLVRFEKVIYGVNEKFSIMITNDAIDETLQFIHENVAGSADQIFRTWGRQGISSINIPVIKSEVRPSELLALKDLFQGLNDLVAKPPARYFINRFSRNQMTFLSVALMKSLFPCPKKGQLLVDEKIEDENGSMMFVFEKPYYDLLYNAVEQAYKAGKFAASNSEADWNDLRNGIMAAKGVNSVNVDQLAIHPLSE
jgi:hypothetical protein